MNDIHCFDVVGTVLFRPGGNIGFPAVECVVIRTYARHVDGGIVQLIELTTGSGRHWFSDWFHDWKLSDNFSMDSEGRQSGRPIEVAIPRAAYQLMLESGKHVPDGYVIGGNPDHPRIQELRCGYNQGRLDASALVQAPVAAVKIDERWVMASAMNVQNAMNRRPPLID